MGIESVIFIAMVDNYKFTVTTKTICKDHFAKSHCSNRGTNLSLNISWQLSKADLTSITGYRNHDWFSPESLSPSK